MAIYQHKCPACGKTTECQLRSNVKCSCGAGAKRVFAFQYKQDAMKGHFNYAVGEYVNNDREFRDALKRNAERNSEATGLDHDYTPVYPGDVPEPPYRGEDQVLDTRAKRLTDAAAS